MAKRKKVVQKTILQSLEQILVASEAITDNVYRIRGQKHRKFVDAQIGKIVDACARITGPIRD